LYDDFVRSVASGNIRRRRALSGRIASHCGRRADRPGRTNFLDIPSIEALESLLADYMGTMLFVTHDRRFAERTADRILEIRDGRVHVFDGGYREYEEHKARVEEAGDAPLEEELTREMVSTCQTVRNGGSGVPGYASPVPFRLNAGNAAALGDIPSKRPGWMTFRARALRGFPDRP